MSLDAGLVDALVRSSLLIALAAAAAIGLRGASASMRHLIWLLGLLSILLIPLLSAVLPRLPLPILPETVAPPAPPLPSAPSVLGVPAPATAPPPGAGASAGSISLGDLTQLFYLTIAAGLLGRLALGHWLLARLWRRARPPEDRESTALLSALAVSLGIRRKVTMRIAVGPAMPMTWGSVRPRILLPVESLEWSEERLRVVLLHELGHVARHDSLSRTSAAIVCALYWFNPAVWYAVRQMRREQEHACDDLVLSLGARASVYARSLLEAAHAFQAPRIVGSLSVAMASPSELERRLTAIVGHASRRRASLRFLAGCGAAALVATSVAASIVPVAAEQRLLAIGSDARPIRRAGVPFERMVVADAAVAPLTQVAARAPAPPEGSMPSVPAEAAPVAVPSPTTASTSPSADEYDRALAEYHRDLRAYDAALRRYNRDLALYNRDLAALVREGNVLNSGNTGNSGNSGNSGLAPTPPHRDRPGIPAVMPTAPTMPTSPTPPTPRLPPKQGP